MELLDMVPLDASDLRLYSLPAAAAAAVAFGSAWAWLAAALAAAVGLWRIRAGAAGSKPAAHSARLSPPPPPPPPADAAAAAPARAAPAPAPAPPSEPGTPTKARFTAYYGTCCGGCGGGEESAVKNGTDGGDGVRWVTATWEETEMAVRRKGDLGWYSYQDMTALDGSVVRLWDGEVTAPPRRRRRAGWEFRTSI